MKILITGGYGYLGQRLAKYFHDSGSEVFLGSRKYRKKPPWLKNGKCFISDWKNIEDAISKLRCIDLVIHSAGMNAVDSNTNPKEAEYVNGFITNELIKACIKNKVKKFIYLSTAHVYANPLVGEISENSNPKNTHPYALSNIVGEEFTIAANDSKKIKAKVLRLSNCFGYPLSANTNCWHLLVNDICLQAVKNKKIILNSDGKQLRDFIPIIDLCRTIEFIVNNCMEDDEFKIFNIGSKTLSINEMTKIVLDIFKKKFQQEINLVHRPKDKVEVDDFLNFQMNWIKKYKFKKKFNFNEEIELLIDFCLSNK